MVYTVLPYCNGAFKDICGNNKLVIVEKPLNEAKGQKPDATEPIATETEKVKEDENVYDEIYFSSGSDDDEDNVGGVSSKSKERRTMKTDDELLYDPNMDDEDEKWVKQQRQEHQQPGDEFLKCLRLLPGLNLTLYPSCVPHNHSLNLIAFANFLTSNLCPSSNVRKPS